LFQTETYLLILVVLRMRHLGLFCLLLQVLCDGSPPAYLSQVIVAFPTLRLLSFFLAFQLPFSLSIAPFIF